MDADGLLTSLESPRDGCASISVNGGGSWPLEWYRGAQVAVVGLQLPPRLAAAARRSGDVHERNAT